MTADEVLEMFAILSARHPGVGVNGQGPSTLPHEQAALMEAAQVKRRGAMAVAADLEADEKTARQEQVSSDEQLARTLQEEEVGSQ